MDMLKILDKRTARPGAIFDYNDANTLILSKIIERVFDKRWDKVFEYEIWSKLGVEDDASVLASPRGEVLANAFFNARPRDYMRLALLMVNDGKNLLGDQVIPEKWVNKILGEGKEFRGCPIGPGGNCPGLGPLGYTYQTWRSPSGTSIFFMGKYGQLIFAHPESRTVVVILSAAKSGRLQHIFTKEMKFFLYQVAK
jgi:CubicO group peptidase (beta-lactamase class C family)